MIEVNSKVGFTNPFPGLRSFELADAYLFFGRDHQIDDLREKLAAARFLAVIGASGSGKSSLVKAGLVPRLLNQAYGAGPAGARLVHFTPEATPIRNFARALHQAFGEQDRAFAAAFPAERIAQLLLDDPDAILAWGGAAPLLVVIDQFEELFRYQQGPAGRAEAARFINLMLDFTHQPDSRVNVVLTMRSDYLDACTDYERLTEAINRGSYLLPRMSRDEIRQAITTPADLMGASITPELTERLLTDLDDRADQLPILQHALMRTWNYWQQARKPGRPIELSDYEAIGTMRGAISVHAEEVYHDLPDDKSRLATQKLFKALIELGPGDTSVVRPTPLPTLSAIAGVSAPLLQVVLDRFREPGVAFITPSTTTAPAGVLIVDLAHERILQLWTRLRTWMQEEVDSAKLYRQISQSAALYHAGKTGRWHNPELQIGLKWLADNRPSQAWAERYDPFLERAINFLEYSRDQADFESRTREERQRRELRRARFFALFLGIGSLVSLFFLIVSAVLRTQARQSEAEALAEKKIALFERSRAESQTREAITQKKIAEQQDLIAEQQKRLTEEQRLIAVREQHTAELKRQEAETARRMAVAQQHQAEAARAEAEQQRRQADQARRDAEQQKTRAELAHQDAEAQRSRAVTAQGYAEQQRGRAIARTLAIRSGQLAGTAPDDDLPALLALAAANLNRKNGGTADNPDIFNALAKAADAGTVLRRHTDAVRTVAVAGSGLLASGSDDGTVSVWVADRPTVAPRTLRAPGPGADGIRTVALSPDGQTVVGGSEKGRLYRWNSAQPEAAPQALPGHGAPVQAVLATPDFGTLVSVSGDGLVRSWRLTPARLDSGQRVRTGFPVYCAQLSPDGRQLLLGSSGGRVVRLAVANLLAPPVVTTRREFGDRVTALAYRPDGRQLLTGNAGGQVYAWELTSGEPAASGTLLAGRHTAPVTDLAFAPNGRLLASASTDWSIHIWEAEGLTQQPIVLADFDAWVLAIGFSTDSQHLVAAGADKTVRIRTVDTNALYAELTRKVKRTLTEEEWNQYIGKDIPYEKPAAK